MRRAICVTVVAGVLAFIGGVPAVGGPCPPVPAGGKGAGLEHKYNFVTKEGPQVVEIGERSTPDASGGGIAGSDSCHALSLAIGRVVKFGKFQIALEEQTKDGAQTREYLINSDTHVEDPLREGRPVEICYQDRDGKRVAVLVRAQKGVPMKPEQGKNPEPDSQKGKALNPPREGGPDQAGPRNKEESPPGPGGPEQGGPRIALSPGSALSSAGTGLLTGFDHITVRGDLVSIDWDVLEMKIRPLASTDSDDTQHWARRSTAGESLYFVLSEKTKRVGEMKAGTPVEVTFVPLKNNLGGQIWVATTVKAVPTSH